MRNTHKPEPDTRNGSRTYGQSVILSEAKNLSSIEVQANNKGLFSASPRRESSVRAFVMKPLPVRDFAKPA